MGVATSKPIGKKPCKMCQQSVMHVEISYGDNAVEIPSVSHQAACGKYCSYDCTMNPMEPGLHDEKCECRN